MAAKPLTMNPNYLAMVRGTRELHDLLAAGREESPEADAIRNATDAPWEALSEVERNRVRGLSEDLYSLVEPPPALQPMNHEAQARLNEAFEARLRGEWDRALDLVRSLAAFLAADVVSFFRGKIWLDAGDIETAALFLEHASRLQPANGDYLAGFLHALERVNLPAARERARQVLVEPETAPPIAVVRAADILFHAAQSLPSAAALQEFRQLILVLERALARIDSCAEGGVDQWHRGIAVGLLAFCHEILGNTQAAVAALTRGLLRDPTNPSLLGARGMLLYGASPYAVNDLELASRSETVEIWPISFLAHHHLITGRFEPCRKLCERALGIGGSPAVLSEVSEWMAIAQAELGFPLDLVRESFENAIRFDPSNERAKRNLAAFETANNPLSVKTWETRSASIIRTSGLAERRFLAAA